MEKAARKLFEKQITNTLLDVLKKQNEKAAINSLKLIKDVSKVVAKKFSKSIKVLAKAKKAAAPNDPPVVKKLVTHKSKRKSAVKQGKRKI